MNKRIFLVGLVGGLLVSTAARYPLFSYLPSGFVEDWLAADSQIAIIWVVVAAILLLLTGVVAARMSGTRNRLAAAGAGAVAGLIAALLAELFFGGTAAGVWGSRLMLVHGFHATKDETEFIYLLIHGVSSTLWWVHLSIWIAAGAGILLGGLGGLVAGSGGKPAQPHPGFWLTVSAVMVLTAATVLMVNISIYLILGPVTQKAADKMNLILPYLSESIFAWPVASSLVWLLLWQLVAWLVVRKAPASRRIKFLFVPIMMVILSFVMALVYYRLMGLAGMMDLTGLGWSFNFLQTAAILLAVAAGLVWGAAKVKFRPRTSPVHETRLNLLWNKGKDFFQEKGEAKVAAWYFLFIAVIVVILVFFIDREGFLLPWLSGGLAFGLLFAALGIRDTRKKVPIAEELDVPVPQQFFAAASLSGFFTSLICGLSTLAPLNLVLIPVVMIASLMLHDEAGAVAAAGGQTPAMIVSMNYTAPYGVVIILGTATLVFALLVTAAGTIWEKLRLRNLPPQPIAQETLE